MLPPDHNAIADGTKAEIASDISLHLESWTDDSDAGGRLRICEDNG
jgi:hypothetical protein